MRLAGLFGDHMLLQRDLGISDGRGDFGGVPIWGWADPKESVTVTIDSQTKTSVADDTGKWTVRLDALPLSATPTTLTVSGKNKIVLNDVLIGDVWICAGQSNMGFPVFGMDDATATIKSSADDQLRIFQVDPTLSFDVQADCKGHWDRCDAHSVPSFSAVGYTFGRSLRAKLNVPIGLIESSLGGTASQAWTSREGLESNPNLKDMLASFDRDRPKLQAQLDNYYKVVVPKWHEDDLRWRKEVNPAYQALLKQWTLDSATAKTNGQPIPPKPQPSEPHPSLAAPPDRQTPTLLYNAMLAPVIPYAIKGVAWYQGEQNVFNPKLYRDLVRTMIVDWRRLWKQGDFPFVYVQVASYEAIPGNAMGPGNWAPVRDAQLLGLKEPQTAMAVSFDVSTPKDVHYHNKQPVGERLALGALHVAYADTGPFSGPVFEKMTASGGTLTVQFSQADGGLMVGIPPTAHAFATPADSTPLRGFEIADDAHHFLVAEASIAGTTVLLHADGITHPSAVRYGWADNPGGNLYNRAGLPASPFTTNDGAK